MEATSPETNLDLKKVKSPVTDTVTFSREYHCHLDEPHDLLETHDVAEGLKRTDLNVTLGRTS